MILCSLDLATMTGVTHGNSEGKPFVTHWNLRMPHRTLVPGELAYRMRLLFKERGVPDFLAIEKAVNAFGKTTESTKEHQNLLHGAALGVAGMYRVPKVLEVAPNTIRVHFIGKASAGSRDETKAVVFRRARLLGYNPKTLDEGDACALHDYVVHVILRQPERFEFFRDA